METWNDQLPDQCWIESLSGYELLRKCDFHQESSRREHGQRVHRAMLRTCSSISHDGKIKGRESMLAHWPSSDREQHAKIQFMQRTCCLYKLSNILGSPCCTKAAEKWCMPCTPTEICESRSSSRSSSAFSSALSSSSLSAYEQASP